MKRKVVRTELEPAEYARFAKLARKKGLTIKEALREAALRWSREESGINPKDPIFHVKARVGVKVPRTLLRKLTRHCTDKNDNHPHGTLS